jgi:hypothetical protein
MVTRMMWDGHSTLANCFVGRNGRNDVSERYKSGCFDAEAPILMDLALLLLANSASILAPKADSSAEARPTSVSLALYSSGRGHPGPHHLVFALFSSGEMWKVDDSNNSNGCLLKPERRSLDSESVSRIVTQMRDAYLRTPSGGAEWFYPHDPEVRLVVNDIEVSGSCKGQLFSLASSLFDSGRPAVGKTTFLVFGTPLRYAGWCRQRP